MARLSTMRPVKTLFTAESIANALGGRKVGGSWMARCPAHDDREPSLSIDETDDGKVLVYCQAGCTQNAVIAALRQLGLWANNGTSLSQSENAACARAKDQHRRDDDAKRKSALKIWQSAKPAYGTAVEKYLKSRNLNLPWVEPSASIPV